ncbi:MAG TPA: hypothetical protein VGA22_06705 [Gemmatimonadales bacterium]|jgi:hypothetical protein
MVGVLRRVRNERGRGRIGCLFSILLVVVIAYYSIPVGQAYFAYVALRDAMRTQAQFAAAIDDVTIQRRILQEMDNMRVPGEARENLRIVRTERRPFQIIISTSYVVVFDFPFTHYAHTFSIEARRPL